MLGGEVPEPELLGSASTKCQAAVCVRRTGTVTAQQWRFMVLLQHNGYKCRWIKAVTQRDAMK